MPKALTGITAEIGCKKRDCPKEYEAAWRGKHRPQIRAYAKNYYHSETKKNPARVAARNESGKWSRRKRKYGVSQEDYHSLLTSQDGACTICGVPLGDTLRVDHDHETGIVRGLLCDSCNTGLGYFKDDPIRLRRAAEYIENSHSNKKTSIINELDI